MTWNDAVLPSAESVLPVQADDALLAKLDAIVAEALRTVSPEPGEPDG